MRIAIPVVLLLRSSGVTSSTGIMSHEKMKNKIALQSTYDKGGRSSSSSCFIWDDEDGILVEVKRGKPVSDIETAKQRIQL